SSLKEITFQVIFTTNVAETSITIPGVRYIVDCGLAKVEKFDAVRRISVVDLDLISKVSAEQRAGRAGRTAPGLLYIMRFFFQVKEFDAVRRISAVDLDLISKVSAEQRAGRAGRTAPGLLYIMN
ncbi:unnamed protein product, partial [Gongylonema pulchrum]|uniref:Helicase C-terminal domain-containing protein n=1 Tax=Gongylonema pulchrum TaxID=637853 RepID=A0A183EUC0_9BILA